MPALTPERSTIISRASSTNDSFIVDAKAGSGKTFTLIELLSVLRGTTTLQAFNKAIATECSERAKSKLSFEQSINTTICTVHSHGLAALRRAGWKLGREATNSGKVAYIVKDLVATYDHDDPARRSSSKITRMVSLAKSAGFGLTSEHEHFPSLDSTSSWEALCAHYGLDLEIEADNGDLRDFIRLAQQALTMSNLRKNMIDFDDMIYFPLLYNLQLPQYNNVLLDEAQDINATRRELAFRTVKPGGRLIAVGDPHQAIYGFTGADAASLSNIRSRIANAAVFGWADDRPLTLPLSTCFRCDTSIIDLAQTIVPGIRAADGKSAGRVETVSFLAPVRNLQDATRSDHVTQQADFLDMPAPGDAILCRLNKPNVAVALGLLRRGVRARIEGRDLGKRLLYHVQRANNLYSHEPLGKTKIDLDVYLEEESRILFAKNREAAQALLQDEVECCQLLIDRCLDQTVPTRDGAQTGDLSAGPGATYSNLEALIESLFGDNVSARDTITLASVHKAKGREWSRVFILGWTDYMPFHLAEKAGGWQLDQEHNLRYVAVTRAEHELTLVTGVQAALDAGLHREVRKPAMQPVMTAPYGTR